MIIWNLEEKADLKRKTYQIFSDPSFKESLFDAFLEAHSKLPLNRQRDINHAKLVFWIHPCVGLNMSYWTLRKRNPEMTSNIIKDLNHRKVQLNKLGYFVGPEGSIQVFDVTQGFWINPDRPIADSDSDSDSDSDEQVTVELVPAAVTSDSNNSKVEPETKTRTLDSFSNNEIKVVIDVQQKSDHSEMISKLEAINTSINNLPSQLIPAIKSAYNDSDIIIYLMYLTDAIKENTKILGEFLQKQSKPAVAPSFSQVLSESDSNLNDSPEISQVKSEKREKKPMILLINLLPTQFKEIQKQFGGQFDFRLWEGSKGNHSTLKSLINSAYKIFGVTKFMNHSDDAILMKQGNSKYVRLNGGISQLRKMLDNELSLLNC